MAVWGVNKQAMLMRRRAREEAIRAGHYGRPTKVIPDKKKEASKKKARGKVQDDA